MPRAMVSVGMSVSGESATSLAERVRRQCEARQLKVRTTGEPMGKAGAYALQGAGKGPHSAVNYGWYAAFLRWVGGSGAGSAEAVVHAGHQEKPRADVPRRGVRAMIGQSPRAQRSGVRRGRSKARRRRTRN